MAPCKLPFQIPRPPRKPLAKPALDSTAQRKKRDSPDSSFRRSKTPNTRDSDEEDQHTDKNDHETTTTTHSTPPKRSTRTDPIGRITKPKAKDSTDSPSLSSMIDYIMTMSKPKLGKNDKIDEAVADSLPDGAVEDIIRTAKMTATHARRKRINRSDVEVCLLLAGFGRTPLESISEEGEEGGEME